MRKPIITLKYCQHIIKIILKKLRFFLMVVFVWGDCLKWCLKRWLCWLTGNSAVLAGISIDVKIKTINNDYQSMNARNASPHKAGIYC